VPVLTRTAFRNKGVHLLTGAMLDYLLSSDEFEATKGINRHIKEDVICEFSDTEPFSMLASSVLTCVYSDGMYVQCAPSSICSTPY
jgi:translation elongation factor EF-G